MVDQREYDVGELDELLEIATYEEMKARPRFRAEVDSDKVKPISVLGLYPRLPAKIRCGLSGCHSPQLKGYLVLCDDETETNIGEDCGVKFFGAAFAEIKNDFDQRWRQKEILDRIRRGVEEAPDLLARLDQLINSPHGAAWLLKSLRAFEQTTPRAIVSEVKIRATRLEAVVNVTRKRTSSELQLYDSEHAPDEDAGEEALRRYEASDQRVYLTERMGEFVGLEVFTVDARATIFQVLKPNLQQLAALDAARMAWKERKRWSSWLRDVDGEFLKVENWLSSGAQFFARRENIDLLHHLPADDADTIKLRRSWDFAAGAWR